MSSSTDSKSAARPRRSFVRRLLADTRGTATTETVIMIPMFAIVWGCIFFVFSFFQRTITMRSLTRGHTWAYAYIGCSGTGPGTTLDSTSASQSISSGGIPGIVDGIIGALFEIRVGHGHRTATVHAPRVTGGDTMNLTDDNYVTCNRVPATRGSYLGQLMSGLGINIPGVS